MTRWGLLAVVLIACGPGIKGTRSSDPGDITSAAARTLADRIASKDVAAIHSVLQAPLPFAGAWFPDAACRQQFPVATMVQADRLRALATCLATLDVQPSKRRDRLFGVALLEDASGIELAVRFAFRRDRTAVTWIGYSGRRDPADVLPSITPAAFRALRTDGEPSPPPGMLAALEADRTGGTSGGWMKVCLDGTGAVTGIHPVLASSPAVEQALIDHIRTWTLRPFPVGGQTLPVCALLKLQYPAPAADTLELLPLPIAAAARGLRVDISELVRTAGVTLVVPEDEDKVRVQKSGVDKVVGSYWFCVNEGGAVVTVNAIESTGLPGYDAKIRQHIASWRYQPYRLDGKPLQVCSAVTFIYTQR